MKTWFQHDFNAAHKDGLSELIDAGGFEAYGRFWAFMELFYSMQLNKAEYNEKIRINERTLLKQLQMNCRSLPKLLQLFHETLGIVFQKNGKTFGNYYETTVPNALNYLQQRRVKKVKPRDIEVEVEVEVKENKKKEKVFTLNIPFETFWEAYGKKKSRKDCERKWKRLKDSDREAIMAHVPKYVESTPEVKYRKDPSTYLNQESWEDDIILPDQKKQTMADKSW